MAEAIIDSLQLEIEASADKAASNIDKLTEALAKLKGVAKDVSGLSALTKQLEKLSQINTSPALKNIDALLQKFKQLFSMNMGGFQGNVKSNFDSVKGTSDAAYKAFRDLENQHERLNEKIRLQSNLYDALKAKFEQMKLSPRTSEESFARMEKQLFEAQARLDDMIAKSDRMAEALREAEYAAGGMSENFKQADTTRVNRSVKETIRYIKSTTTEVQKFGKESTKATNKATSGFEKFGQRLKTMLIYGTVRRLISMIKNAINEGLQNIARGSEKANAVLSEYTSSFMYLKNSIAAALMPLLEALAPIVTSLIDKLAEGFNYLGMLIAALTGKTTYTKAIKTQEDYAESLSGTASAAKEAKKEVEKALLGIDEINKLSFGKTSAADAGTEDALQKYIDMFEEVEIPQDVLDTASFIKDKLLPALGLLAGAFAALKLADLIKNMLSKNSALKSQTDLTNAETSSVTSWATSLAGAAAGVATLIFALPKLKDALENFKLPDIFTQPVPAPSFAEAVAPKINTKAEFEPSALQYSSQKISSPTFSPVVAPEIDAYTKFSLSKTKYQSLINAPIFEPAVAPEINFALKYDPSKANYQSPVASPAFETPVAPTLDTTAISKFSLSKTEYTKTLIKAPSVETAIAPELDTTAISKFSLSKTQYQTLITPPEVGVPIAPEVDTTTISKFSLSKTQYQTLIEPPEFKVPTAPEIELSPYNKSIDEMTKSTETGTESIKLKTTAAFDFIGDSITKLSDNTKINFENIQKNIEDPTKEAFKLSTQNSLAYVKAMADNQYKLADNMGKNSVTMGNNLINPMNKAMELSYSNQAKWANASASGMADWGNSVSDTAGKASSNIVENIVGGISSAWDSFKSFMNSIGEKISSFWTANKSWLAPTTAIVGALGLGAAIFLSGGSLAAAAPAALSGLAALPAFAKGGVVKEPTFGLFGEYANARSNPEIIAPQSIMFETMKAALESTGGNSQSGDIIVQIVLPDGSVQRETNISEEIRRKNLRAGTTIIPISTN